MRTPTVVDRDEVVYKRFLSVCNRRVQYPGKGEEEVCRPHQDIYWLVFYETYFICKCLEGNDLNSATIQRFCIIS